MAEWLARIGNAIGAPLGALSKFVWIEPLHCQRIHGTSRGAIITEKGKEKLDLTYARIRSEIVRQAAREEGVVSCEILSDGIEYILFVTDCHSYVPATEVWCLEKKLSSIMHTYALLWPTHASRGTCYVIVHSPRRLTDVANMDPSNMAPINDAYLRRDAMKGVFERC